MPPTSKHYPIILITNEAELDRFPSPAHDHIRASCKTILDFTNSVEEIIHGLTIFDMCFTPIIHSWARRRWELLWYHQGDQPRGPMDPPDIGIMMEGCSILEIYGWGFQSNPEGLLPEFREAIHHIARQ
jgi:hypothetical protein